MWNNPRLLNAAASGLVALAIAIALFAAGSVLVKSPVFSLRSIRVLGELRHVEHRQIVDALQGRVSGSFFTVKIEEIRGLFQGIPWVRRAEVRRLWPDQLEVRLEEHVALARWGQQPGNHLVNVQGEAFSGESDADLPIFAGPPGSEREVTRRYALYREIVAPLGFEPRQVLLSPRHAWQLKLSSGLTVQLGRDSDKDPLRERLARFVDAYPRALAPLSRRLDYVDLRYPNGFALRVPELAKSDPQKTSRRGKA